MKIDKDNVIYRKVENFAEISEEDLKRIIINAKLGSRFRGAFDEDFEIAVQADGNRIFWQIDDHNGFTTYGGWHMDAFYAGEIINHIKRDIKLFYKDYSIDELLESSLSIIKINEILKERNTEE